MNTAERTKKRTILPRRTVIHHHCACRNGTCVICQASCHCD